MNYQSGVDQRKQLGEWARMMSFCKMERRDIWEEAEVGGKSAGDEALQKEGLARNFI